MLITDNFVMLNFPKTGSTFARTALKKVYGLNDSSKLQKWLYRSGLRKAPIWEHMTYKIDEQYHNGKPNQHGTYRQIPEAYRDRPVLSIMRNPLDRYISTYRYRWWVDSPPATQTTVRDAYPNFPNLSFREYYRMTHELGRRNRLPRHLWDLDMGYMSIQFIQFYYPEPYELLEQLQQNLISIEECLEQLPDINFIRQERLLPDLKTFLRKQDIEEERLSRLDSLGRINQTQFAEQEEQILASLSGEFIDQLLQRERLIYTLRQPN